MKQKHEIYNSEKTSTVNLRMLNADFEEFSSFCESIGYQKSAYIKYLINKDRAERGLTPLFTIREYGIPSDTSSIPNHYVNALEYAKEHGIKRTTMIQRLKSGKYPSAMHIGGKWYIDPNEASS